MKIVQRNIVLLDQMTQFLEKINVELFITPQKLVNDSTLGQHTRHILEFYACLIEHFPSGTVCYDKRLRNRLLEESLDATLAYITNIKKELLMISNDPLITFEASYSADNDEWETIDSSLKRELAYTMDHTIHHLAIIKIILSMHGIPVDTSFGVAPSTLRFHNKKTSISA